MTARGAIYLIKTIPTNDVEIRINARSAGDFGFMRTFIERSPQDEYRVCEEIVREIKRHVDGVGWTHIQQKHVFETEDGSQYDTLFEALEYLYDDGSAPQFEVRFVRPNDKGIGTATRPKSFDQLIETAYKNPHEFSVVRGNLTTNQKLFLDRVLEAALPKEATPDAQ